MWFSETLCEVLGRKVMWCGCVVWRGIVRCGVLCVVV